MLYNEDTVRALREALAVSPDNLALRRHLAELLSSAGKLQEAVAEYRHALGIAPRDDGLRMALAKIYVDLGSESAAMVIVEEVLKQRSPPPAAYILYAQLLLQTNQPDRAAHAYRQAVTDDPSLIDAELARKLSIDAKTGQSGDSPGFDDDDRRVRLPADEGGEDIDFASQLERPKITFADVGGMESLKEEIRLKILHPLVHPDLYKMYGKTVGGGILMYGPPGCGKTYLARATAGEAKAGFLAVGIEDVLDMWLGNSERRLHQLFETARGKNAPCMLFFDEVDALGAKRTDMRTSAARMLVNQFLSELDGVNKSNEGVLILAATNAPWHVDSAFRRPGRFDRVLFVPPPDAPAREDILQLHLKGKPLGEIDYKSLAAKTNEFSGADLKAVIDLAIEAKLGEAMKTGRPAPILTRDLLAAVKRHRPTTKEWFGTAKNYAVYSNQDGTYDDIVQWMKLK